MGITDELRERTALRYMGNCKCGRCQLVPRELLDRALRHMSDTDFARRELLEALKGVVAVSDRKTDEYDRAHAAIAKAGEIVHS